MLLNRTRLPRAGRNGPAARSGAAPAVRRSSSGRCHTPFVRASAAAAAGDAAAAAAAEPAAAAASAAVPQQQQRPGKRYEVVLPKPAGVVFAQLKDGPVFVESVVPGGNAARAGVKAGDILSACSAVTLKVRACGSCGGCGGWKQAGTGLVDALWVHADGDGDGRLVRLAMAQVAWC
jgi:hypothetical protein